MAAVSSGTPIEALSEAGLADPKRHPPRMETAEDTVRLTSPLDRARRVQVRLVGVVLGVLVVVFFNFVGPLQLTRTDDEEGRRVVVDVSRIAVDWIYLETGDGKVINRRNPYSLQTIMWVAFFLGLAEIWIRRREVRSEAWLLKIGMLPEDERTMLPSEKLSAIYTRARKTAPEAVLPTLLRRLVMEFRKSHSVNRVNSLLDSSLELMLHNIDLRYSLLRYLVWIVPTLGFVGTVIGIADALSFAGSGLLPPEELLLPTTQKLGVAFYTTLLALLQASVLMLGLNLTQASEELVLNEAGQYCLENLVVRLVEPSQLGKSA